jgi:chemotaxis protein MotB
MNPRRALRQTSLAAFAIATLALAGCGDRDLAYRDVEIGELKRVNAELERKLAEKDTTHVTTVIKNSSGENDVSVAQNAVGSGATTSTRDKELVISVESNVLFKPGSATLSTEAKSTLNRVAALVKQKYANHYVRIEGHTDDEKVSRSKNEWDDNWDLSGGRAQVVLHYLNKQGVDSKDLGFAGYADQRPLAPNKDDKSRAKNRRVEIVVIPK